MDSTTAGSGDELVATLEARELWMDVNLRTLVAPLIATIDMPSTPFELPRQLGDVNFYPGTENMAASETALGTGRRDAGGPRAGRPRALLVHARGGRRGGVAAGDQGRAGAERGPGPGRRGS